MCTRFGPSTRVPESPLLKIRASKLPARFRPSRASKLSDQLAPDVGQTSGCEHLLSPNISPACYQHRALQLYLRAEHSWKHRRTLHSHGRRSRWSVMVSSISSWRCRKLISGCQASEWRALLPAGNDSRTRATEDAGRPSRAHCPGRSGLLAPGSDVRPFPFRLSDHHQLRLLG